MKVRALAALGLSAALLVGCAANANTPGNNSQSTTSLVAGDRLELLSFVGGG